MIRRIEALNYRSLRYLAQPVKPFQLLVGPNASGKSTFLGLLDFIRDLLRDGLPAAVLDRSPTFQDLLWMGQGDQFEIAVEMAVPAAIGTPDGSEGWRTARYVVAVGAQKDTGQVAILGECLWLIPDGVAEATVPEVGQPDLFPSPPTPPITLLPAPKSHAPSGWKKVVAKMPESGNDYFYAEKTAWNMPFRLGPLKPALANLPEDNERFPVAIWFKRQLLEGIHRVVLNSEVMRRPSPPLSSRAFQSDGSSLPWAVERLRSDPDRFRQWINHIRTAIPDISDVVTVERQEDRHRYLKLCYSSGLVAPSWVVSDGTLRLLALTLMAYLDEPGRIYLIEEPENGIHPQALETVFQSLSSTYESQIFCSTHSPVLLSLASPGQILCFARDETGATDVRSGDDHPRLREWRRKTDLGTLFASGVLG